MFHFIILPMLDNPNETYAMRIDGDTDLAALAVMLRKRGMMRARIMFGEPGGAYTSTGIDVIVPPDPQRRHTRQGFGMLSARVLEAETLCPSTTWTVGRHSYGAPEHDYVELVIHARRDEPLPDDIRRPDVDWRINQRGETTWASFNFPAGDYLGCPCPVRVAIHAAS